MSVDSIRLRNINGDTSSVKIVDRQLFLIYLSGTVADHFPVNYTVQCTSEL